MDNHLGLDETSLYRRCCLLADRYSTAGLIQPHSVTQSMQPRRLLLSLIKITRGLHNLARLPRLLVMDLHGLPKAVIYSKSVAISPNVPGPNKKRAN